MPKELSKESDNSVNKRHHRLQPMVMVWNTYFPNGKMIPLRQPQPPVYFGPAAPSTNSLPQSHYQSVHQQAPMMNENSENIYNHPHEMYQQEIAKKGPTNQEYNGIVNSQCHGDDLHNSLDSGNASVSNITTESSNCPSNSPSPTFPHASDATNVT